MIDVDFSADGAAVAAIVQRVEKQSGYWAPAAATSSWCGIWPAPARRPRTCPYGPSYPKLENFGFPRVELSPNGRTAYTSEPLSAYDVASGSVVYTRSRQLGNGGVRQTTSNVFDLNPAGTLLAATESPDRAPADRCVVRQGPPQAARPQRPDHGAAVLPRREVLGVCISRPDRHHLAASAPVRWASSCVSARARSRWRSARTTPRCTAVARTSRSGCGTWTAHTASWPPRCSPKPDPSARWPRLRAGGTSVNWLDDGLQFYDIAARRWGPAVGEDRIHEGITWNSAGTQVGTVGDGFVAIWDPASSRLVDEAALDGTYAAIDFSPDDTRIALLDDAGDLSMLDAATLEPVGVPLTLGTPGGAVSLGPDGRALVLSPGYVPDYTFDHQSRQWVLADLDTGMVVDRGTLDFDAGWLVTSPDGRHAAVTGWGGEARRARSRVR